MPADNNDVKQLITYNNDNDNDNNYNVLLMIMMMMLMLMTTTAKTTTTMTKIINIFKSKLEPPRKTHNDKNIDFNTEMEIPIELELN